jgi:CRISPR-associated protein Cas1
MSPEDNLFGQIKNGVLTLAGYVSRVTVETANLCIIDGYKDSETKLTFPRSNCPVSRILSLNDAGYISFAAARWLHETGIAFTHLNYEGSPILVTVSRRNNPSSVRRAQVMLYGTDFGREIARSLIQTKIAGQIANLKHFDRLTDQLQSQLLRYASKLLPAENPSHWDILGAEGMVANLYWQSLTKMPPKFGRKQTVPKHWKLFRNRRSTITGDPRGAVTPGNAMLNYLYGVLCSQVTIALHTIGLDPSIGILHKDKDNRASLAYDLMEPSRPILDRWFFHWLQYTTFSKRDFFETIEGFIRVTHPLNSHLAMTAVLWRGLADQLVRWFLARLTGDMKAQLQLDPFSMAKKKQSEGPSVGHWAIQSSVQFLPLAKNAARRCPIGDGNFALPNVLDPTTAARLLKLDWPRLEQPGPRGNWVGREENRRLWRMEPTRQGRHRVTCSLSRNGDACRDGRKSATRP